MTCQLTSPTIVIVLRRRLMYLLSSGKNMGIQEILSLLINPSEIEPRIPCGVKQNVSFLIDNSRNAERKQNKKCGLSDDCGAWAASSSSPKSYFISDLKSVFLCNVFTAILNVQTRNTPILIWILNLKVIVFWRCTDITPHYNLAQPINVVWHGWVLRVEIPPW